MYVDWEYYKIFYYVAKYQNFTKAARVLGNNQPEVSTRFLLLNFRRILWHLKLSAVIVPAL